MANKKVVVVVVIVVVVVVVVVVVAVIMAIIMTILVCLMMFKFFGVDIKLLILIFEAVVVITENESE
jgi:hypothetical protein